MTVVLPLLRCHTAIVLGCLLLAVAPRLHAQDEDAAPDADVPTLGRVEALRPEEEPIDLYRFENPVSVESNRFAKAYKPPPSPEEMALEHGGYINHGINLGLQKSWQGIKKVTGMRPQIQPATARAAPLDDDQQRRAARLCDDCSPVD